MTQYIYVCAKCGKKSKPIGVGDYRRLLEDQKWFCTKDTLKKDRTLKTTIAVSGGFILKVEDY